MLVGIHVVSSYFKYYQNVDREPILMSLAFSSNLIFFRISNIQFVPSDIIIIFC